MAFAAQSANQRFRAARAAIDMADSVRCYSQTWIPQSAGARVEQFGDEAIAGGKPSSRECQHRGYHRKLVNQDWRGRRAWGTGPPDGSVMKLRSVTLASVTLTSARTPSTNESGVVDLAPASTSWAGRPSTRSRENPTI